MSEYDRELRSSLLEALSTTVCAALSNVGEGKTSLKVTEWGPRWESCLVDDDLDELILAGEGGRIESAADANSNENGSISDSRRTCGGWIR